MINGNVQDPGRSLVLDRANAKSTSNASLILESFLANNADVEFLLFQALDFAAVPRGLFVTLSRARRLANENGGIDFVSPMLSAMLASGMSPIYELCVAGKDIFNPDWSSLRACRNPSNRAVVQCNVDEHEVGFERCPRTLLTNTVRHAASTHKLQFLIGFEIEFYVTSSAKATAPIDAVSDGFTPASHRQSSFGLVEEAVRNLERAGVEIWGFHSEMGSGCYEISTGPLPPVEAVDALLFAQETIRAVADSRGLHATMHPKPFEKLGAVGLHTHLSISPLTPRSHSAVPSNPSTMPNGISAVSGHDDDDDEELKPVAWKVEEDGHTAVSASFLAGVLASLPALCALTMPNYDSYSRLIKDDHRLPWIGWSSEGRLSPARRIGPAHWEFRPIDATANMYLTLTALIGVGLAAVARGDKLTVKPRNKMDFDYKMDEELRKELGITQKVPLNLREALEALRKDENVKTALGVSAWERYLLVKTKELEACQGMSRQERVAVYLRNF